jgi:hypothetical protein
MFYSGPFDLELSRSEKTLHANSKLYDIKNQVQHFHNTTFTRAALNHFLPVIPVQPNKN